ncbi:DUF58 domain-containing protein [Natronococcus wangiae]|uniref:DUF58 domain-containing protein n=1 Tax=Natronococcus wangiae TaxID=3068275 RepID=UPI00273EC7E3|nr:DUF58 domain-containing protein [Natronococcus sp. AD5]
MRPTRQIWGVGVLAVLLAGLAVVFARPLLLAATVLLGAWLLSEQYRFLTALRETTASLTVVQAPVANAVRTDESTPVTLQASLEAASSLSLTVVAGVPPAGTVDDTPRVSLDPDETVERHTTTVNWPVAGRHRFAQATLTATDGSFETTLTVGPTPEVTVEPRGPRSVHIGKGGDRLAIAPGDHETGRFGSGTEPAELREYVPGDTADRIDWKTTARQDSLYVREYEAETNRPTMVIVDHRNSLGGDSPAASKLSYLREAALAMAAGARQLDDPVGLITVGDEGLTSRLEPATGPTHYLSIRRQLLDLEPTETSQRSPMPAPRAAAVHTRGSPSSLEQASDTSDRFARTLEPFYGAQGYETRLESDPLLGAVRYAVGQRYERTWMVLCTDDSNPEALYEAILLARQSGNEVLVLLTPTPLFSSGGLADVERAYDRYRDFDAFRRKLDRMEKVTALEVAPDDRLSTVLGAGRKRAQARGGQR